MAQKVVPKDFQLLIANKDDTNDHDTLECQAASQKKNMPTLKASRFFSSSSRRSPFGPASVASSPSNLVVNLPALKASVADGGRVMLGIVNGLQSNTGTFHQQQKRQLYMVHQTNVYP